MAENITAIICGDQKPNENVQIILSALAVLGTLVTTMAAYCLKQPRFQALVGLGAKAQSKKQLHDSIKNVIPQLDALAQQLSARSDSPDTSAALDKDKTKVVKAV